MGTFDRLHLIRQVDLFTLKLFLSAIEEQQIGLAAIRENIAASTATKRIQALEDVAGVELLERGPKGVVPTAAGAVLERCARQIFAGLEGMRAEIAAFTDGMQGRIVVASARTIIVPFLARELADFGREFPLAEPIVHEVENSEVVRQVARGEADVGVFAAAYGLDLSGVDVTPYRQDRIVVAVPRTHPLSTRTSATVDDLLTENLIVPHALVPALQAAARRLGQHFEPRHRVRSAGTAISLVQAGLGVTVQPECLLSKDYREQLAVLEFDEPWARRRIHLCTANGRVPTPAARTLIGQLLDRPRASGEA